MTADALKTWVEIAQGILTSVAIIVGGVWAYYRFVRLREMSRCVAVSHTAECVAKAQGRSIVRLGVRAHNVGKVQVRIEKGNFRLYALDAEAALKKGRTANGRELRWRKLDRKDLSTKDAFALEPGESWTTTVDFEVPDGVSKVLLYSFFADPQAPRDAPSGWQAENVFTVDSGPAVTVTEKTTTSTAPKHAEDEAITSGGVAPSGPDSQAVVTPIDPGATLTPAKETSSGAKTNRKQEPA